MLDSGVSSRPVSSKEPFHDFHPPPESWFLASKAHPQIGSINIIVFGPSARCPPPPACRPPTVRPPRPHKPHGAESRGPPVLYIALEYMGMVLDCPCLALDAQLVQKSNT